MHVPISKTDLFQALCQAGFSPSDDGIGRLRSASLLGETITVRGRGNERFFAPDDADRVRFFYYLIRRNRLAKPRHTEIAFWFAAYGYDVPPALVRHHVTHSIEALLSMVYRIVESRANGEVPSYALSPENALRLGDLLAKLITRRFRLGASPIVRQLLGLLLGLVLRSAMRGDGFSRISTSATRLLASLRSPDPSSHVRVFWNELTQLASLLKTGQDNGLIVAVESDFESDPQLVSRAALDAIRLAKVAGEAMPWFVDASPIQLEGFSGEDARLIDRHLVPGLSAALWFLIKNPKCNETLMRLREGDDERIRVKFQQVSQVLPILLRRIGAA